MTHPTYHEALNAALSDILDRLRSGRPHGSPVSGPHAYTDGPARRLVTVRLRADLTEVDDSGAWEEIEWLPVCDAQRMTPGYPIDAEEALWAAWLAGAPE